MGGGIHRSEREYFSLAGHADCVAAVRELGLPLMVLGGGGYTVRNVARCWTLETAVLLDTDLPSGLPQHEYWEYFAPDFSLTPELSKRLDPRRGEIIITTCL